jgi:AAA family ATP:ADP antiporter
VLAPDAVGDVSGRVFYVWFSVFNLFSTMVFWALMADRFTLEQAKRLFGVIAVGGTCGAIVGPTLAILFVERLGTPSLLVMAALSLVLAVITAWAVTRLQPEGAPATSSSAGAPASAQEHAVIGGSAFDGIRAVLRSRYLLGISTFVLILAVIATFIYFTRLQMVAEAADTVDMQTGLFARIDLITQVSTLVLQALVAGHLMRYLGVPLTLALLPITVALGFVGLAVVGSLAALIVLQAAFNAVQRAIMRPARETLFTVVSRSDKYKSKAFTDTFVYRGGDVLGAFTEGFLGRLGFALGGLVSVVIPLALVWGALGIWLGRAQARIAAEQ